jgi:hypothetical protein
MVFAGRKPGARGDNDVRCGESGFKGKTSIDGGEKRS